MDAPVTILITIVLIFIYITGIGEAITDCGSHNLIQYVKHSFVHADFIHLFVNIITLLGLIYLERRYGSFKFAILIVVILFLSSFIHLFINFGTCSVGFSGVLIGLIIYQRMIDNNFVFDNEFFKQLLLLLLIPWLLNPKISLTGHAAGAIAGLSLAFIY